MANPLLLDIVLYLKSHSVVKGDGVDAFRDFTPEHPDNIVSLIEYTGNPVVPFEPAVHRSVQVVVRDKSADAARRKSLEIFNLLNKEDLKVDFTSDRWGQVSLRQTPFRQGVDKNNRVLYVFNMGITTTID